jgi:hypothetical protein
MEYFPEFSLSAIKLILFYDDGKIIKNLTQLCRNSKEINIQLSRVIVSSNFSAVVTSFDDDGGVDNTQTYNYPLITTTTS